MKRNLLFVMSSLLTCQFRFDAHSQHERGVVLASTQSGLYVKAANLCELWHALSEYFHKLRLIYPIGHESTIHWNWRRRRGRRFGLGRVIDLWHDGGGGHRFAGGDGNGGGGPSRLRL